MSTQIAPLLSAGYSADHAEEQLQRALAGFARALKFKYEDIEVGIDYDPEPGLADNGDLEHDLQALLESAGETARSAGTALILFIDELQYVEEDQMAALITAPGPTRNQLISKGMIWSPNHGDTAFTVPMFDQFMKRIMPGEDWRAG